MLTLYHYVHCPFCVRVRLALGYLGKDYKSVVLQYDDEKTPIQLSGKKMLPILKFNKDEILNESLDIIQKLDSQEQLYRASDASYYKETIDPLLNQLGDSIHSLVMPYWIYTKEFSPSSRNYFQSKKEVKRGPFRQLVKRRDEFEGRLRPLLDQIETQLGPFYQASRFGLSDILLASHLWGLYVLPEFQFSSALHNYLQEIKKLCRFSYHADFWLED